MKALVTGGAGFIGSHLVEQLLTENVEVAVCDNLTSANPAHLAFINANTQLVQTDIRDLDALILAMEGIDFVFHLAALTSVSQSVTNPLLVYDVNVTGTLNVLWAALKAGVSRVVIASSCAVYGDANQPPLQEAALPAPKSPYAASKLADETFAESFYHSYGLETVCLRYFNVYGLRQRVDSDYAAAIPRFINCYQQQQSPQVYGDGLQSRDFIHVTDVAKATSLAATLSSQTLSNHRIFNVGTGVSTSILKLLEIISKQADYTIHPAFKEARNGDIRDSWADCTLSSEALGFLPQVQLQAGIKDLYKSRVYRA